MTTKKLLYSASALWLFLVPLSAEIDFSGYYENRFFILDKRSLSFDHFHDKFKLGDYNRLRLSLQASPSEKVSIHLAVDFYSFHGAVSSPLGKNDHTEFGDEVTILPDRLFAEMQFKKFDLSVGRQRIALGISYLWAPLDIFSGANVFEPKEEKSGVNAFRFYLPLGTVSSLTAVFATDDDLKSSTSVLRIQSQVFNVDTAFSLIHLGRSGSTVYGFDMRGENWVGWWMEAAFSRGGTERYDRFVLGFDATFPIGTGLYWLNEFYYDSSGSREKCSYDWDALYNGDRNTLGRVYLMSMLRYNPSELWSASFTCIGNLGDGSILIGPSAVFDLSRSILVSGSFYFPLGSEDSELGRARMNIFMLRLKIHF